MKSQGIMIILVIIMLILLAGSDVVGYFVYKEYKEKIAYFDEQNQLISNKFADLGRGLEGVRFTLEDIVNSSGAERKRVFSRINDLREDIKNLQDEYAIIVTDLREQIRSLKGDVKSGEKENPKRVELGEISVEKSGTKKE